MYYLEPLGCDLIFTIGYKNTHVKLIRALYAFYKQNHVNPICFVRCSISTYSSSFFNVSLKIDAILFLFLGHCSHIVLQQYSVRKLTRYLSTWVVI